MLWDNIAFYADQENISKLTAVLRHLLLLCRYDLQRIFMSGHSSFSSRSILRLSKTNRINFGRFVLDLLSFVQFQLVLKSIPSLYYHPLLIDTNSSLLVLAHCLYNCLYIQYYFITFFCNGDKAWFYSRAKTISLKSRYDQLFV